MSGRETRGVVVAVWRNFVKSLILRPKNRLIGEDHLGNKYFEGTRAGLKTRYYVPPGGNEEKFDEPLPCEWESWLRRRRREPPTDDELRANQELSELTKLNAAKLEEKYKCDRGLEVNETSGKIVKGIESFPLRGKFETVPGKTRS